MIVFIIGVKSLIYLILLYPNIIEQHTSLILTAFFFFFYSYYFAFVDIFFIADVFIMVDTIEFMLFCGNSFIIYGFFMFLLCYYYYNVYYLLFDDDYCFYNYFYYSFLWP
jgi:hypothetical protein